MIRVGIIGATGYAGGELVRILLNHKDAKIVWYGSRSYIDKKYYQVYQNMFQLVEDICKDDNLEELAKQAVRKYSQLFILQKIKLEIDIDDRKVLTDKKWLVFVIGQILSNALKYTKQGKISIYTQNQALVIEDTGIGIEAEELPRVFERGFTGYNGRRDGKSTGIGLYLCKRVMDKLSHGIAIDSVAGKGTKVYLILGRKEMTVE